MRKEREYTIVTIEATNVWYPTIHKHKVKAINLEQALTAVCEEFINCYDEDVEEAKEDVCSEGWVLNKNNNECIALAYNKLLDDQNAEERILKGYIGKRKIFDILDVD